MLYVYRLLISLRLGGCWFVVDIRRFIYTFLNVCPFDYTAVAESGKVGPVNQVNHTSWVAVVTLTDRPKSVRNRCVIELFCDVVCVAALPFWHFCWWGGFCHRTESDLFLFSLNLKKRIEETKVKFKISAQFVNAYKRTVQKMDGRMESRQTQWQHSNLICSAFKQSYYKISAPCKDTKTWSVKH